MRFRFATMIACLLALGAGAAHADDIILTITGQIADAPAELTRADLETLPQHRTETSTTVTDGTITFDGFLMRDLLDLVHAEGDTVIALALNDYQVEIPISDFYDYDVIGAMAMQAKPLSPRDKGPIWIIYPRDDYRELQDIRYDMRWVWQLRSLHVK